ncbi:hypothetical protein M422DRAFT_66283 [Sphaerobolus stellatus SS14]|nr:hypothetical protein M422DRAFT_66283 [Sphaerobolus stellatus SS14]
MAPQSQHVSLDFSGDDGNGAYYSQDLLFVLSGRPWGSLTSVCTEVKNKAADEDPNNGKCLIAHQFNSSQFKCVTFSQRLYPQKKLTCVSLDALEWWWGKEHKSLNVVSSLNLFFFAPIFISSSLVVTGYLYRISKLLAFSLQILGSRLIGQLMRVISQEPSHTTWCLSNTTWWLFDRR